MNRDIQTENTEKKKTKRGAKIALCILLSLVLVIGAAAFVFREEIALIYFILTTPEEAVESQKIENDKKTQELLEEIAVQTMRDLTEEERKMLASGALSMEDAMALIRGETLPAAETSSAPEETTSLAAVVTTAPVTTAEPIVTEVITVTETSKAEPPQEDIPETTAPAVETTAVVTKVTTTEATVATTAATTKATTAATTTAVTTVATTVTTATTPKLDETVQKRQNEIIAEIYLLRATYLNEIDALIQGMKDTYSALPEDQRGLRAKMKIVEDTIPKGNALEAACDAQMEELLTELENLLLQSGNSTAIIAEIEQTYLDQKALKKSELYNEYFPKLKQ